MNPFSVLWKMITFGFLDVPSVGRPDCESDAEGGRGNPQFQMSVIAAVGTYHRNRVIVTTSLRGMQLFHLPY